jgi:cytochrome c
MKLYQSRDLPDTRNQTESLPMIFRSAALLILAGAVLAACNPTQPAGESTAEQPSAAPESTAQGAPAAPPAPPAPKLTLADLPAPYASADLAAGEAAYMQCRACHQLDPAMGNTVGPNLHGVFARAPGGLAEYRYSDALKAHAAKVSTWTPEELDRWLADPSGYLPGSAMFFNGVSDPAVRTNLVAYLLIQSS